MPSARPSARKRRGIVAAGALLSAGCLALATGQASAEPTAATTRIVKGTVAPEISGHRPIGAVAATQTRQIQLWLTPKSSAESFAQAVSTPGSASYRHYLTPKQYSARYGAGPATISKVERWLSGQGFRHITTDSQHNYISAQAPVGNVQKAFAVKINQYRVTGTDGTKQTVTSNDRNITLPADLSADVSAVTGLDNIQPQTFHAARKSSLAAAATDPNANCSTYFGQKVKKGLPTYHGGTSFSYAGCGYTAGQLRAAYGMNATNDGAGQTVAYIEVGTPYKMVKALKKFASLGGLPAPKAGSYNEMTVGSSVNDCGNAFDVEEQLDVEAGYAMAPGAKHLLVGGDGCSTKLFGLQALLDAQLAVLDGSGNAPFATIESNSWGISTEATPGSVTKAMHAVLVRAAGEGVGMYFSSGDAPGMSQPADDPLATSVGGTSLGVGAKNQRLFETGWSNTELDVAGKGYANEGINAAAGGGASLLYKQPSYQAGVVPNKDATPSAGDATGLRRAAPDISALADAYTGIQQVDVEQTDNGADFYDIFADGGTSLSSPLIAGMIATVQQGGIQVGFANPALYSLAGTTALHDPTPVTSSTTAKRSAVFCPLSNDLCWAKGLETFDSQDRTYTDQNTTKGYDTMTGIGTPNGQTFITALRKAVSTAD